MARCLSTVPPDVDAQHRWRSGQYLTDQFWIRWRREYFQGMQTRTKWEKPKRNLRTEDVVLVKEEGAYRNEWPIGRVSEAIASDDGQVRKVQVKIVRGSMMKTFLRPVKEIVLLVPAPTENHK